jgi:hypothetical protein
VSSALESSLLHPARRGSPRRSAASMALEAVRRVEVIISDEVEGEKV